MKSGTKYFLILQRKLQFFIRILSLLLSKLSSWTGLVTIPLDDQQVLFHVRYPQERRHALDHEIHYFRKLMEAGGNDQCFWDIGANIGLFSVSYAKRYPGSKVMAFEPMPLNYLILQENIALNHLRNIAAHQIAIGNDNSKVTLRGKKEPGWGGSSLLREEIEGEDIFVVDVFSVDHLCLTRKYPAPTFVKIDVEGFEMEVFKGMEQIIKAHHPRLFVELHEDYLNKIGISLENALDLLCTEGYRLEFMEKHKSGNQFQCIFVPKAKS